MKLSEKKLQKLKEKKISIEELNDQYFIDSRGEAEVENILELLNENICSFEELVDKFKSFKELHTLLKNTSLLKYIIAKNVCSFQEVIDKFKSIKNYSNNSCLYKLLENKEFFEELIKNDKLTQEDMRYLLNRLDNLYELDGLFYNTSLTKDILDEFVLNKELVDRFNTLIENDKECKRENIHTIFDFIERENQDNKKILKLNDLNKKVYLLNSFDLNEDQRLELIDILKSNEIAQNKLNEIIDNHLESNYDFESLKVYLKKTEKKNILNI